MTQEWEVVIYRSKGDKDHGWNPTARGCYETEFEAIDSARTQARNGYWVELFNSSGEYVRSYYPE